MPEIGQTLSHFKIVEKIGEGGMGQVFLADDTTLDRKVALKFLPEAFTRDPERMARFEREAKLLASLNHPNIAGIHGLEQADGNRFLVLEYVEGETLQARLSKGALPIEDALALCRQIAEGLEAAHEKGVIHRDLKPANVMITAEEKVKILDFGLAKAFANEQSDLNLSNSPTLSLAATQQGVILGTAAYMSPEQARGKEVDRRADIWAFGVVLFEMLTGKQIFAGDTVSDTLASVLAREPEWESLPRNLHPRIRLLLERCLKKDPMNRYHDVADARVDIQEVLTNPGSILAPPILSEGSRTRFLTMIPWIAAALILGAVLAGFAVWKLTVPDPLEVIRFDYELPKNHRLSYEDIKLAISPDGKQFVYSTKHGIYLRRLGEFTATLIPGTDEDTIQPFFSPDGESIGYWSVDDGKLKRIAVAGGTPQKLCEDPSLAYYDWAIDGNIYYASTTGIMRVSQIAGDPQIVIPSNDGEIFFSPQLLPDGKSVIYTLGVSAGEYQIVVQSLGSNDRKILFEGATARYLSTGHLIYVKDNDLKAVPFNIDKLATTGGHYTVVEDILVNGPPHFCVSNSGTFAYLKNIYNNQTLVWVDFHGAEEKLDVESGIYRNPRVSPDGSRIALNIADNIGNLEIGILNITHGFMNHISQNIDFARFPNWSHDSQRIVFAGSSESLSSIGIYQMSSSGTGIMEHLYTEPIHQLFPTSLSTDGKILLCQVWAPGAKVRNIGMLIIDRDPQWQLIFEDGTYNRIQPRISPDGRWIAYTSDKSGQNEIYVCSFPDVEKVCEQISTNGGNSPLWSPNSRKLYYRNGNHITAATYDTNQGFDVVSYKELLPDTYYSDTVSTDFFWDIHPDGDRFLMMKETLLESKLEESRPRIGVIVNWFEELKEKVPVP